MTRRKRAGVLADVAERVALWNEFRTDDFQDRVARLVHDARESWRVRGELPRPNADPMFDALLRVAEAADSSPITVRDACADALRESEEREAGAA